MTVKNFRITTNTMNAGVRKCAAQHNSDVASAMKQVANLLRIESSKRAPKREGHLASSIKGEVKPYRKSVAAIVYVPENSPASPYAIPMHENHYNIGHLSSLKQAKVGVPVGRRYMARALVDSLDSVRKILLKALHL